MSAVYISRKLHRGLIPAAPLTIATRHVSKTLANDVYPGIYSVYPHVAVPLARGARLWGLNYTARQLKDIKKGFQLKALCIAGGNWTHHLRSLQDHETWTYVSLALAQAQTGKPAAIDAIWQHGLKQARSRYVQESLKVRSEAWTKTEAAQYMERIISLANIIQNGGRVPRSDELAQLSGRADEEVGIAIGADGELLHFRKGHHRMALAKQLGIPRLDIELHLVHSDWLRNLLGVSRRGLIRMIGQHANEDANVQSAIAQYVESLRS